MSQVSDVSLANQGFSAFRTELNNILAALNTMHLGSSRPSSGAAGTIWLDSTGTNTITMKLFDGSDDLTLFSVNTSTNLVTLPSSVAITETDPNAVDPTALAIALG